MNKKVIYTVISGDSYYLNLKIGLLFVLLIVISNQIFGILEKFLLYMKTLLEMLENIKFYLIDGFQIMITVYGLMEIL